MDKRPLTPVAADAPLTDPVDDGLSYSPFAQSLANALLGLDAQQGMVLAIYGAWGAGKTTVLNFVEHYLKAAGRTDLHVLRFNPWWYSGSEDLVREFFSQLGETVTPDVKGSDDLRETLADLGDAAASLPIPYAGHIQFAAKLLRRNRKGLAALREKTTDLLLSQQNTYAVFIDDIDRLTADEVRQLFRVIKAVGSLPRVIYLLAFDTHVVTKALDSLHDGFGTEYLEKIVQVPFELPSPDRTALQQLLLTRLNIILGDVPEEQFDQQYWGNVYLDGIDALIRTPRDVTRFTNALSVTFTAVKGEVNPVDFVAVEALRVFLPDLYAAIRANPGFYVGAGGELAGARKDDAHTFHKAQLERIDDKLREPVNLLLQRIFPRVEGLLHNVGFGSGFEESWRRKLRVCSPDVFPVFFRFSLPTGAIGAADLQALLAVAGDACAIARRLKELSQQRHVSGITRAHAMLQRLQDYTESHIPDIHVGNFIHALFDVGDDLRMSEPEPQARMGFGIEMAVGRLIWQLLRRQSSRERGPLLTDIASSTPALITLAREISVLGQQHGRGGSRESPEEERILNADDLDRLQAGYVARIQTMAESGALESARELAYLLLHWMEWGNSEDCVAWVRERLVDDGFVVHLLKDMVTVGFSHTVGMSGLGDRVARKSYQFPIKALARLTDPVALLPRVQNMLESPSLCDAERRALKTFLKNLTDPQSIDT